MDENANHHYYYHAMRSRIPCYRMQWSTMCGVWMDGDVLPVSCLADCGGFVWRRDRSDELAV